MRSKELAKNRFIVSAAPLVDNAIRHTSRRGRRTVRLVKGDMVGAMRNGKGVGGRADHIFNAPNAVYTSKKEQVRTLIAYMNGGCIACGFVLSHSLQL